MLLQPVGYSTSFIANGLGFRSLQPTELGLMFGLNEKFSRGTQMDVYPFPPVQIMDSILKPLLTPRPHHPSPSARLEIPPAPIPTATFLPSLQRFLPTTWADVDSTVDVAAKSDDAAMVFRHWDDRITLVLPHVKPILPFIRKCLLSKLFIRLYNEFKQYLRRKFGQRWHSLLLEAQRFNRRDTSLPPHPDLEEFSRDWSAGSHVLSCYNNSSYFGWERGSALIFWRWHPSAIKEARDGFLPFLIQQPPIYLRRPHPFPEEERRLFFKKIFKFIETSYIIPNSSKLPILSVVDYFAVPKGDSDIRPVFNGTTCGLNGVA